MTHTLRYQHHDFELPPGEFIVGRATTCQLSLDDPLVSRRHARMRVTRDAVVLEDLGSVNGVRVNGERIERPRRLEHGDRLLIGSQEMFLFEHGVRLSTRAASQPRAPSQESGRGFGALGHLADKALAFGRGAEAERLIGAHLEQLLEELWSGRDVPLVNAERAAGYAIRIASLTAAMRWTDYVFLVYTALGRACPTELVDELYTVMRKVQNPSAEALRDYLRVLRSLTLGPAERFVVSRLEGLERSISAR